MTIANLFHTTAVWNFILLQTKQQTFFKLLYITNLFKTLAWCVWKIYTFPTQNLGFDTLS